MRKSVIVVAMVFMTGLLFARIIKTNKTVSSPRLDHMRHVVEPLYSSATFGAGINPGPAVRHGSRDSDFFSTLVDSSKNGYGPYNGTPNPLAYSYDNGWVAVYRQWAGFDVTAGYIGVAQSEDGEEWFVEQQINNTYPEGVSEPDLPTATGTPQGRYPSAAVSSDQNRATAIWNEYTNASSGGGTYGGRPMFAFDFFDVGENSNFSSVYNLNTGCTTFPCDPPDLWVGNTQMIDGDNGTKSLTVYSGWAGSYHYMIQSLNVTNGYITPADPYILTDGAQILDNGNPLWYADGGYTSGPDFHINSDGIGYMAQIGWTSYWEQGIDPEHHTLFFKMTEDYGETWTSDDGYENTGYYFLSDAANIAASDALYQAWTESGDTTKFTYNDTIEYADGDYGYLVPGWWFWYDLDVRTDRNGGLHAIVVASPQICLESVGCDDADGNGVVDSTYIEGRFGGAGMMHLFNPDPIEEPLNWTAYLVHDMSEAYYGDWVDQMTLTTGTYGPEQYFYPSMTMSADEDSDVMWYAGFAGDEYTYQQDSTLYVPGDIDLFMAKSTDNGATWTELENVTNTSGTVENKALEVSVHLASIGTDDQVGVFFQMPEFSVETYPPAAGFEDYMNRVYVGIYTNDEGGTVGIDEESLVPEQFVLKQNYPNPFNPLTHINYSLKTAGEVRMDLYDIRGSWVRSLVNEVKPVGSHEYVLDASDLSSGIYFYTMAVNGSAQTRKLVLMK